MGTHAALSAVRESACRRCSAVKVRTAACMAGATSSALPHNVSMAACAVCACVTD